MQTVKISDSLVLVRQPITATTEVKVRQPTHHMWIIDGTGSLSSEYRNKRIQTHVVTQMKRIPIGDMLSMAWFSSEGGQYEWFLKLNRIVGASDYAALEKIIQSNLYARGTTCFHEVLESAHKVIADGKAFDFPVSLAFLTDGDAVVYKHSTEREYELSSAALKRLEPNVSSAMFIGYGPYYRADKLALFAASVGGGFMHSNQMESLGMALADLVESSQQVEAKQKIELHAPPLNGIVFAIRDNRPVLLDVDAEGMVGFAPTDVHSFNDNAIYMVTEKPAIGADDMTPQVEQHLDGKRGDGRHLAMASNLMSALYGAANVALQRDNHDLAMAITAGYLGDVEAAASLDVALTNDELGEAAETLRQAIGDPGYRFRAGRKKGLLPAADAFCAMNVFEQFILRDVRLWPRHSGFRYTKIGASTKTADGYPEFVEVPDPSSPISDLGWNESLPNMTIDNIVIPGRVHLMEKEIDGKTYTPADLGLAELYPCIKIRKYAAVSKGQVNFKTLAISSDRDTFDYFKDHGMMPKEAVFDGVDIPYVISFEGLKVLNRNLIEGQNLTSEAMARYYGAIKMYKAHMKVYKAKRDQHQEKEKLDNKVALYLEANGIRGGIYQPKTVAADTVGDSYMSPLFEIKMKGYSSPPAVSDVEEKIAKGAKLNGPGEMMREALEAYEKAKSSLTAPGASAQETDKVMGAWADQLYRSSKRLMQQIDNVLNQGKLAMLLGRRRPTEFGAAVLNKDGFEEFAGIVDGQSFTFVFGKKAVEI